MKKYTKEEVAKFNTMSIGFIMDLCEKPFTATDMYNYYLAILKDMESGSLEKTVDLFNRTILSNSN